MLKPTAHWVLPALAFFVIGCSSESNSITSKIYHNTSAHYNGYYYARVGIEEIEETIRGHYTDDYSHILRIFPGFDTTLAKSYDDDIQEVIKMASLSIQHHPNSKWLDDDYILVGKARLYSLDWGNAIQTFKYVNTKSKDRSARHRALLWLVRTFVEHKEYANALAAVDYVQKEKLSKETKKLLYVEKAYYYQALEDYDNMVRNLILADPLLKKKDRPGRIYFIIGQVYQQLGFESEAFNYYKKCLSTNPEYEVDFYARLYMAQVTEISRSKDINGARKSFRKLLKDSKNKEFRDKIYYEMGIFELKQSNMTEAIEDFNFSVRTGSNRQVHGETYLRLGEIYFDKQHEYETAQAYYDSALSSLSPDYEDYAAIQERQKILTDFVTTRHTLTWQDSLLELSALDSASLYQVVADAMIKKYPPETGKKRKRTSLIAIGAVNAAPGTGPQTTAGSSEWYFGNPAAVASGKLEFQETWGKIPLEDNWRRSLKSSSFEEPVAEGGKIAPTEAATAPIEVAMPTLEERTRTEFDRISQEVPKTDEQRVSALGKIEDATFHLGDIYYFNLEEKENAAETYQELLSRFSETEYRPEVLYKLYLIFKDTEPDNADRYAGELKTRYPNTSFARVLINPDYLRESSITAEAQKQAYNQAYTAFRHGDYQTALALTKKARGLGESYFAPNLELLDILIEGKTGDITQYQYKLGEFIKQNPDSEITPYADTLLTASREFQVKLEKSRGIRYVASFDEPHYFVMAYPGNTNLSDRITDMLERLNKGDLAQVLHTSSVILDVHTNLTMVTEFNNRELALTYLNGISQALNDQASLRNQKFDTFVITKDNFDILYRTKGLNEYLRFYRQNYSGENP